MKLSLLFLCILVPVSQALLEVGFYEKTCPTAEKIVKNMTGMEFVVNPSITASLLRSHFVDCVDGGCDASILIGTAPEKSVVSSSKIQRLINLIHGAKTLLEEICPMTVSCTDIFTLATRDAVALSGGPQYNIPTGRRDGIIESSGIHIPGANDPVSVVLEFFKSQGFNTAEAVALMGAHSVGVAHCNNFVNRLFDFNNTGKPDPTMDPKLVLKLTKICEKGPSTSGESPAAFLDQNTSFIVDNAYYNQILKKKGIMQIDQQLALDESTAPLVSSFAKDPLEFEQRFAEVMVKLASSNVVVGDDGEIRKNCGTFNTPKA